MPDECEYSAVCLGATVDGDSGSGICCTYSGYVVTILGNSDTNKNSDKSVTCNCIQDGKLDLAISH